MAAPPPSDPLRIIVVGLGTVGRAVVELVKQRPALALVGGVELGDRTREAAQPLFGELPVTAALDDLPPAHVVLACVGPRFDRLAPTLRQALARHMAVISDCAEMTWPWLRHPHLADVIGNEARKANVPVVGVSDDAHNAACLVGAANGVAPTGPVRIRVTRQTDLRLARPSLHRQIGVGRTAQQFRRLATERLVGVFGQAERVVLIAQALGRHPMRLDVSTSLRPVLDPAGAVAGVHQRSAWSGDGLEIEITDDASFTTAAADDTIEIESAAGHVAMQSPATLAERAQALTDVITMLPTLPAGLLTPLDLFPRKA